ncbi:MAG: hypothetical protein ISS25_01490 [Nanoarchaeota archaeon]|nr:hypothetical protein [DPANN group archaeon]MBL7116486.1 hypothetical protein [Nanoarchaeota archaeon]
MISTNKFYVIEGDNCVGKTSVLNEVSPRLDIATFSTPGIDYEPIREIINTKGDNLTKFLFYLSSNFYIAPQIQKALESKSAICDRYIISSFVDFMIQEDITFEGIKLADSADEKVQRTIMNLELERDKQIYQWLHEGIGPVFVETWHVGNLAHCQIVAPNLFKEYLHIFKNILQKYRVHCFYLDLNSESIYTRTHIEDSKRKSDLIEFHREVGSNMIKLLKELNIPYSTLDANRSLDYVKKSFTDMLPAQSIS